MAFLPVKVATHAIPDRMIYMDSSLSREDAALMATDAVAMAKLLTPKMSGGAARRLLPISGRGFFGVRWADDYVWFLEAGTKPFTMWSLRGKTIPMWIDDPTGQERRDNPKAKTRTTASGKTQVLIFRRATRPGAPGRIAVREHHQPHTRPNRRPGAVQPGNIGVKWRNPGHAQRGFINHAMSDTIISYGLEPHALIARSGTVVAKKELAQALSRLPSVGARQVLGQNPSADELRLRRGGG